MGLWPCLKVENVERVAHMQRPKTCTERSPNVHRTCTERAPNVHRTCGFAGNVRAAALADSRVWWITGGPRGPGPPSLGSDSGARGVPAGIRTFERFCVICGEHHGRWWSSDLLCEDFEPVAQTDEAVV